MGTDYYPRLSAVASDNIQCKIVINQQAEIAILILAPVILVFLVFSNWAVLILYSAKFSPINDMILWAALGMFFKAASWSIGFVFLAKGASKVFFWSELISNIYTLLFNIIGYYYFGLTGLGLSFLLGYFILLIQVFFIAKIKYEFGFDKEFQKIFILQFSLALFSFLAVKFLKQPYPYVIGVVLIVLSAFYSLKELDKRMDLVGIIHHFTKK